MCELRKMPILDFMDEYFFLAKELEAQAKRKEFMMKNHNFQRKNRKRR